MWQLVCVALLLGAASAKTPLDSLSKPIVLKYSSFDDNVYKTPLPFIVALHDGDESALEAIDDLAKELEGLVFVGTVDVLEQQDLVEYLNADGEDAPNFIVYPFGKKSAKTKPASFSDMEAAIENAKDSIPSNLVSTVTAEAAIQPFLASTVSQGFLPAIFFVDKDEVPSLVVKVAVWMSDNVRICVYFSPDPQARQNLEVSSIPHMTILVPQQEKGSEQIHFGSAPYDKKKFGAFKLQNLLKFFMGALTELTSSGTWTPGKFKNTRSDDDNDRNTREKSAKPQEYVKPNAIFEITSKTKDYCASSYLGLCIIAFLDGAPENQDKGAQIELLRKVQNSATNKGRPLKFMWVDGVCHSDFANAFDVPLDQMPTIVVVAASKGKVAKLRGSFSESSLNSFIHAVLGGKESLAPVTKMPVVDSKESCVVFHEKNKPIVEEPLEDLDDILKEMQEESEIKQQAKNVPRKTHDDEDYELKEKKRKAQEEVERLNKLNKPKKKSAKKAAKKPKLGEL